MTTEQKMVRAMLKPELLARQHCGKTLRNGKKIKPEVIRAEIERRIANTTERYGAWSKENV